MRTGMDEMIVSIYLSINVYDDDDNNRGEGSVNRVMWGTVVSDLLHGT
jgi:hypothetical protein